MSIHKFSLQNIDPQELAARLRAQPYLVSSLHLMVWLGGLTIFIAIALQSFDVKMSVYRSLSNLAVLALLFYINSIWLVNHFLLKGKHLIYYFLALILLLGLSEFRIWTNSFFELNIPDYPVNNKALIPLFSYITSAAVLVVSTLFRVLQQQHQQQKMDLVMENKYQQAQLQFLKAQINPHFLFNTLNNIYALAILESKDTPKMILKLSELLRYAIYEGQKSRVLLSKEWEQIEQLVELFQMKAPKPLNIQLEVLGTLENQEIEPMMLIPLVENCLKHADFELNESVFVKISLDIKAHQFNFSTSNSKAENNYKKDQLGGVGLQNIQSRLELNYKGKYQLEIQDYSNRFELSLEMPFSTSKTAKA
jgi:two-component system LytT family sensor kinase